MPVLITRKIGARNRVKRGFTEMSTEGILGNPEVSFCLSNGKELKICRYDYELIEIEFHVGDPKTWKDVSK